MDYVVRNLTGGQIAKKLGLVYIGKEYAVKDICSAVNPRSDSLTFIKDVKFLEYLRSVSGFSQPLIVIMPRKVYDSISGPILKDTSLGVIISENPRLDFIKACNLILPEEDVKSQYFRSFRKPTIGHHAVIHPSAIIYGDTEIGDRVVIHAGVVIGKSGFGYERDKDGAWLKFPHVGKVMIEDDVEIGANTVIDRAPLDATIIGRGTKIDNLVHVAHSVHLGKNCMVVACALLGGSCSVGDGTWIGGNASVLEHIRIGRNCLVGMGAVVTKDIPDNTTVAGVPAEPVSDFAKKREFVKRLMASETEK
ncbi:MAG: UDP-3-O-(3-hydroxymyristoyl)glucosamine N-acyltransferase [Candidatus Atabeyarchaeum deiterrae]